MNDAQYTLCRGDVKIFPFGRTGFGHSLWWESVEHSPSWLDNSLLKIKWLKTHWTQNSEDLISWFFRKLWPSDQWPFWCDLALEYLVLNNVHSRFVATVKKLSIGSSIVRVFLERSSPRSPQWSSFTVVVVLRSEQRERLLRARSVVTPSWNELKCLRVTSKPRFYSYWQLSEAGKITQKQCFEKSFIKAQLYKINDSTKFHYKHLFFPITYTKQGIEKIIYKAQLISNFITNKYRCQSTWITLWFLIQVELISFVVETMTKDNWEQETKTLWKSSLKSIFLSSSLPFVLDL